MSNKKSNNKFLTPDFLMKPFPVYELQKTGKIRALDGDVYAVIYWFHSMKDGECRAANTTIARILGSSPKSVGNALTRLEAAKVIMRTFADPARKERELIIPLVTFARAAGNAGYHQVVGGVPPAGGTQVPPGGGQSNNTVNDKNDSTAAEPATVESTAVWIEIEGRKTDAVAECIKRLAETVNPACSQHYSRLTQRQPLQRLIQMHGHETVFSVIALLPKTNRIAYLPSITTPAQLETKWAQLEAGLYKLKHKDQANAPSMAGLEDVT